jgi:hypothetical protein
MTTQRTPDGYQNLGTQFETAAGGTVTIPPGTVYASTDNNTGLNLPTADAIGGSALVIENLDAGATPSLNAAAGDTIDGSASSLLGTSPIMVVRTGPNALRSFAFA